MNALNRKMTALLLTLTVLFCGFSALAENDGEAVTIAVVGDEATEEKENVAEEPVLLATVNGEQIWSDNSALLELVTYYTEYYSAYGYDTSDSSVQSYLKYAGLQWAIEDALYRQKAEELNVTGMTDEQKEKLEAAAKTEWDEAVAYYAQAQGATEESTEEEAAAARIAALAYIESTYGYTEESYIREYVESSEASQMRQNVQTAVLGDFSVSEEEIVSHFNELVEEDRASYETNVPMYEYNTQYMGNQSYFVPEGYRGITHILLEVDSELLNNYKNLTAELEEQQEQETADKEEETSDTSDIPEKQTAENSSDEPAAEPEEPVTQEMVHNARQAILDSVQTQVDEIMSKYLSGMPFADLIAEYGTDPGMTTEPNKTNGYAVHKDSILWDPAFTEGAMTLSKIGDVSEPVIGSYGVHILHYTRDIPSGAVELTDTIREELKTEIQQEQDSAAVTTMVEEWRSQADIQMTPDGQAIIDAAMAVEAGESVTATEATEEALADGN